MGYYTKINEKSMGTLLVITDKVKGRIRRNLGNNTIKVPVNKLKKIKDLDNELKSDVYTAIYLEADLEDSKLMANYCKFVSEYGSVKIANSISCVK